jgi:hypothetical protein
VEAVLNQGRTPRTGRGRGIPEAMTPLHGEEKVVESSEVEVHSHWRQERGRQPLPDEVPREQRQLGLDARERLILHPVPVDAGGLGGLQEGRVHTGEVRSLQQEVLEGYKLRGRLASEGNGPLWQRNPSLKSRTHPVGEVEGRPAAGRQLVEDLLNQQGLGPLDWAGEAKPSLREGPMELREGQPSQAMGPDKIPQDSAKRGCCSCWKRYDLGKVPSLGGDVDLKDLDPLKKSRKAAASPGPDSGVDAGQDSVPGGLHRV